MDYRKELLAIADILAAQGWPYEAIILRDSWNTWADERTRNAERTEALRPFAEAGSQVDDLVIDEDLITIRVAAGTLRKARDVI